jgi:hypothetical protein
VNKSNGGSLAVLARLAFLSGIFALTPIVQAQIDFSSLNQWRGVEAQRGPAARPESTSNSTGRSQRRNSAPALTDKEIKKEREEAERMVATIREKLSKPKVSVTWSETAVNVDATGGYLNTPPSPAGVFAAVAAGAAGAHATSMTSLALRRTAAILVKAAGESEETAAFLAGEAASSMEGGNLRVRVDDAAFVWNDRRQEQFRALLQEAEEAFKDVELANNESNRIDNEIVRIDSSVQKGTLSADKAESEKRELSNTLEAALKRGSDAQKKIRDLPKKVRYVLDEPKAAR